MATPAMTELYPFPAQAAIVSKGHKWTREAAQKAAAVRRFLRVGGTSVTRRVLSGADKRWNYEDPKERNAIFDVNYRISGTPEDVRIALEGAGFDAGTVARVINEAINRNNYQTTHKALYDQEIAAYKALKCDKTGGCAPDWAQIRWFAERLNADTVRIVNKEEREGGVQVSPSRARRGRAPTIQDAYKKLADGKVLNVSNIDPATGKGFRTRSFPKSDEQGLYGDLRRGLKLVSSNLDNYRRAITLIFGPAGEQTYAEEIRWVSDRLAQRAGAALGPLPTQTAAPLAPLGAQLAPLATFQAPAATFQAPAATFQAAPAALPGAQLAPVPMFAPVGGVPPVASPNLATIGGQGLPNLPQL